MILLLILLVVLLIIYGEYKLCNFMNKDEKNKKINKIVVKIFLFAATFLLGLLLYNGIIGFVSGSNDLFCISATSDCYEYGLEGGLIKIIKNLY